MRSVGPGSSGRRPVIQSNTLLRATGNGRRYGESLSPADIYNMMAAFYADFRNLSEAITNLYPSMSDPAFKIQLSRPQVASVGWKELKPTFLSIIASMFLFSTVLVVTTCADPSDARQPELEKGSFPVEKSAEEWKALLGADRYQVMRLHGTERAFTGEYNNHKENGVYLCAACGQELFASSTKYDSGTGWPSFYQPITRKAVGETRDESYGMVRTEVHCSRCGGHLGHVFPDGPRPTGLRYCINSISLKFRPGG